MKHLALFAAALLYSISSTLTFASSNDDGHELYTATREDNTSNQNSIQGDWSGQDINFPEIIYSTRMHVEHDKVTMVMRCQDTKTKDATYVRATVPAIVTETTIEFLEAVTVGDIYCNFGLPKMPATPYEVHFGILSIQGYDRFVKLPNLKQGQSIAKYLRSIFGSKPVERFGSLN